MKHSCHNGLQRASFEHRLWASRPSEHARKFSRSTGRARHCELALARHLHGTCTAPAHDFETYRVRRITPDDKTVVSLVLHIILFLEKVSICRTCRCVCCTCRRVHRNLAATMHTRCFTKPCMPPPAPTCVCDGLCTLHTLVACARNRNQGQAQFSVTSVDLFWSRPAGLKVSSNGPA